MPTPLDTAAWCPRCRRPRARRKPLMAPCGPTCRRDPSELAAVPLGPADVAVCADGTAGVRAPSRHLLEAVDVLGGLGLGEVTGQRLARLAGQGLEVAALRAGHGLVAGDPVLGVLDRGVAAGARRRG